MATWPVTSSSYELGERGGVHMAKPKHESPGADNSIIRDGEHASCMLSRNSPSHHRANLSARRIAQVSGAVVKNLVSGETQVEAYVAR